MVNEVRRRTTPLVWPDQPDQPDQLERLEPVEMSSASSALSNDSASSSVNSTVTPTTSHVAPAKNLKPDPCSPWNVDSIGPVGCSMTGVEPPAQQQNNSRKAIGWYDDSIGKAKQDPALDFFKPSPVKSSSATSSTAVQAKEAAAPSYAAQIVDKAQDIFNWLWGVITGKGSEAAGFGPMDSSKIMPKNLSEDEQKQLNDLIAAMSQLMTKMNEISQDEEVSVRFEEMMSHVMRHKNDETQTTKELMRHHFTQRRDFQDQYRKKMQETLDLAAQGKLVMKFEDIASSLQLFATAMGLSGAAAGAAFLVAFVATADTLLDDRLKKFVAGLFAKGDQAAENSYVSQMKMGLGLMALAVSLRGFNLNNLKPLSGFSNIVKGSASIAKAKNSSASSYDKAHNEHLLSNTKFHGTAFETALKQLEQLLKMDLEMHKVRRRNADNHSQAIAGIFR